MTDSLSDRTMLLIGAAGFVGRHVCDTAGEAGLRVVAAARGGSGMRCDLLDPPSVDACVEAAHPALVVNMAGAPSVASSWEDPDASLAVNATGVSNLLEAVARHSPGAHVLCVSSGEVYGEAVAAKLPFSEDLTPAPVTPYGESKAAMEAHCGRYAQSHGLRIAVVRAFNLFGPGQPPPFAAASFARQIAAAEADGADRIELAVGNRKAARDFTDVRDGARAFVEVSQRELIGVYNLCSGKATKLEALIGQMAEATPLPLEIVSDPALARPVDPPTVYGSPDRLREAIGWAPRIPLSRSVADLLDWWRAELAAA